MSRLSKLAVAIGLAGLAFTAYAENVKLTVAASPVPHAEILEALKPTLAKQGVDLEIKIFNDYVLPNTQVQENSSTPISSSTSPTWTSSTRIAAPHWWLPANRYISNRLPPTRPKSNRWLN